MSFFLALVTIGIISLTKAGTIVSPDVYYGGACLILAAGIVGNRGGSR